LQELRPFVGVRDLDSADVLVEIQDQLQSIPRSQVGERGLGTLEANTGLDVSTRGDLLVPRHGQPVLQKFVGCEGEAELGRRTNDTSGSTLEEGLEALLFHDGLRTVTQASVSHFTFTSFDLQTSLDHVARSCEISRGHTSDRTSSQQLYDAELLGGGFAEEVTLKMGVGGEVDSGKRNCGVKSRQMDVNLIYRHGAVLLTITKQTGTCSLVQTNQTQVLHDPKGRATRSTLNVLRNLTLNLQTDLDDFKRVGENLGNIHG
jgi:hypothetical protein